MPVLERGFCDLERYCLAFVTIAVLRVLPAETGRNVCTMRRAMAKNRKNIHAAKLARSRWARIPKAERSRYVPRTGGRPREYPHCRRYGSHRFSPKTGRCPCGYNRLQRRPSPK
jgi:hypothetical protein